MTGRADLRDPDLGCSSFMMIHNSFPCPVVCDIIKIPACISFTSPDALGDQNVARVAGAQQCRDDCAGPSARPCGDGDDYGDGLLQDAIHEGSHDACLT
jgi:hypothetical protein